MTLHYVQIEILLGLKTTNLPIKDICYLVNILTFILLITWTCGIDKADIFMKEKI